MAPRLPERGTPAYTAVADQYEAAQQDATRQAAALFHAGARLVAPTGPWAARLFASVLPDAPTRRRSCTHLRDARGPMPMFTPALATLTCTACQARAIARGPADPACDGCGRAGSSPLPQRIHIAQRGLVIARGRLCFTCANAEHHPGGPR